MRIRIRMIYLLALIVQASVSVHGALGMQSGQRLESLKFGPFAVINADDYYGSATFSELIRTFDRTDSNEGELACSMVGFRLRETLSTHGTVSRGICVVRDDYLNTVEEWTKIGNSPLSGIDSSGKNGELTGGGNCFHERMGIPTNSLSSS